ncbi:uncharacterized protein LOC110089440 [Pogona vitticeps]
MNFLILTLALAIVTGSQAFVLRDAPAPPSKTAQLFEATDTFFDNIEKALEKKWDLITESKTGKAVTEVLDEDDDDDDDASPDVELSADVQDTLDNLVGLIDNVADIAEKLFDFMDEVENASKPILKKIDAAFADLLAPYFDPVLEELEAHLAPLGRNLANRLREIDHNLEERLKAHLEVLDSKVPEQVQKWKESRASQKKARK